ncbi:hypothetical protein [Streptomyces sp. NPDC085466]|uniref:hypothetical protein n=1 Tax=Streptomyces sp. NPDC085466 TaxID=3365725 RepID=UPI0037D09F18
MPTEGAAPCGTRRTVPWVDPLGIPGRVAGVGLRNMDPAHPYTVGFANADAQYLSAGTALDCVDLLV